MASAADETAPASLDSACAVAVALASPLCLLVAGETCHATKQNEDQMNKQIGTPSDIDHALATHCL